MAIGFNSPIFADAEEDNPVDRSLDGKVDFLYSQGRISQSNIPRQERSPVLNLLEKFHVDFLGGSLPFGFDVFIKEPFENRLLGEDGGDLFPPVQVFFISKIDNPSIARFIPEVRADAAVIDGKLFKVGEDREGEPGGPGIAAELVGGADLPFYINGGFLGFDKELASSPDPKTIIGGLGDATDFDGVFGDDVLVSLGVALLIVDVPAQGLEERIDELGANVGFLVTGTFISFQVSVEYFHQSLNFFGGSHISFPVLLNFINIPFI
ncbi:MAG: hypothetical protein RAO92_04335 [Candidatus Euphemobacter frigidus]|nr:hypothetical protein [Candidatus Euphemobacter frigidus]MDP8275614.1 hypothetical protein [Candidatus Euphemobacter frigidus]